MIADSLYPRMIKGITYRPHQSDPVSAAIMCGLPTEPSTATSAAWPTERKDPRPALGVRVEPAELI
jgi:hypothetical protein